MAVSPVELFDKLIDVKMFGRTSKTQSIESVSLVCPRSGIKPDIKISGSFTADILTNAELRMKNYYSPVDLASGDGTAGFKWLQISAGYANSMVTSLEGQIWTGYQENPPPDGDTVFTFMTGWFAEWMATFISVNYPEGTSVNSILSSVCSEVTKQSGGKMSVTLSSSLDESFVTHSKVAYNTSVSDFCISFGRSENLTIVPDGRTLRVNSKAFKPSGSGKIHTLDYMTDVKKTAAGLTITAPWVPAIRPGDLVGINSRYFSSDISGMFVKLGTNLLVINEDFAFDTVGPNNRMVLETIRTDG